ncbi:ribonuclease J [Halobacteriovorax sp. HFRX-2_2]|uniref:ribonuclease J n=1 Tax=unclassified Halobacteriovorax TaxID=2639665 RepID=UPI0037189F9D
MSNLNISPLGGVGQIGSNATLVSYKNTNIIIDSGILFPYEDCFDINYLIPDLKNVDVEINALIITHGHEDHIGAISHYIERFPEADVYAPTFAKELIEDKLSYLDLSKKINKLESKLVINEIEIDTIHVNHSIPNTKGIHLGIKEIDTGILFISDFKCDFNTEYEEPIELEKINLLSKKYSNRLAMLDSTNITSSNERTTSESELKKDLLSFISDAKGRVFITCFASNIHRLQTIFNIAKELKLNVVPYGRSLLKYTQIARECEIFNDHGLVREVESVTDLKKKHIILCSGSQGEFRGTVKRITSSSDKYYKLNESDTFIFSSKAIPGNEKKLALLYNEITEKGCEVITHYNGLIHASGHPGKADLKDVYDSYQPTIAIPIHGETYFLRKHCEFIKSILPTSEAIEIKNHDSISLSSNGKIKITRSQEIPPILIHGNRIVIEREKISERRKMATLGTVFVSISKNSIARSQQRVHITTMGIPHEEEQISQLQEICFDYFNEKGTIDQRSERIRVAVRRYFQNILGYRPLAIVHIC